MAQAPKRFGDPEVAFVFIPDGAAVPLPSSDLVRLRARLVREPGAAPALRQDRPAAPDNASTS